MDSTKCLNIGTEHVRRTRSVFLFAAVLALFVAAASGCTFNHNLSVDPRIEIVPPPAKSPITVGVYYSPEFVTYKHSRIYGPHRYIISAGKESAELFDKLAAMSFQKVVHLDGLPPFNGKPADVDAIIEPDITSFHFRVGFEGYTDEQGVGYRLNMFSKDGVPLVSANIFGQEKPPKTHFYPWGHLEPDMQDAAAKILREFQRLPEAVAAAKTGETSSSAPGAGGLTVHANAVDNPLRVTDTLSIPLKEVGIIAVSVSVGNGSDRSLSVSDGNFRLVLPGGRTISSTAISAIPSRLEQRSYAFEAAGIVGAHLASQEEREKRAALLEGLKTKAFGDRVLQKGESTEGLVFFVPAEGTPSFNEAALSVWGMDAGTHSGIRTSEAVAKLHFTSLTDKK